MRRNEFFHYLLTRKYIHTKKIRNLGNGFEFNGIFYMIYGSIRFLSHTLVRSMVLEYKKSDLALLEKGKYE